jgi:hypothetical protein
LICYCKLNIAFATSPCIFRINMRSSLFFLALPALGFAAPPVSPQITKLVFSGSGCPNDSGSVKSDTATLGDSAGVSFTQLKGTDTDNCAVHIQSAGGTPGWQAAVKEITYEGDVNLKGNSELDTFTQVFWSENAGNTVSCTGHEGLCLSCALTLCRELLLAALHALVRKSRIT